MKSRKQSYLEILRKTRGAWGKAGKIDKRIEKQRNTIELKAAKYRRTI